MDNMQPSKTSSVDAMIIDFITIRDFLKDSNQFFKNSIESKTDTNSADDCDNWEILRERSTNVLRLMNDIIKRSLKESQMNKREPCDSDENTSYLDMSLKKYESYELTNIKTNMNPNDYVDVTNKITKECNDDDNIYDNYIVERNGKVAITNDAATTSFNAPSKSESNGKPDCPFNGLPAAHLTIMHSPKVGWLTMHLRRRRFIRRFGVNFKRKYYTGLVMKPDEKGYCEWWMLMYAGGTCDLKPTICLPINQFEACADQPKITKNDDKQSNDGKRNLCKFEMNELNGKKDAKTYCFIAESPEHCEQWINLLKQLSTGAPYVENSFTSIAQIRKLPMPPLNVKSPDVDCLAGDMDTVDNNVCNSERPNIQPEHTAEVCNYSEGVYEEPEEYYKNIPVSINKGPKLPVKTALSQSTASTIRMDDISEIYDTPKKPVRKSNDAKHYDLVPVKKDAIETKLPEPTILECNRLKIDDEIRSKLSTRLKEQSDKYISGQRTSDEDMIRNSSVEGTPNKYQLSTMRKWLFSNHLAKLRQTTNPTNSIRKSSGSTTAEANTEPRPNQRLKTNAIAPSSNDAQKRAFSVQPKGTKVHMIINQLEANGQLTLLSGGGTSTNKTSALMST